MAGFAINLEYLERSPNATMPYKAGFEEDEFLKSIGLKIIDIEPKARNCSEILVWHTQTKKDKTPTVRIDYNVLESDETSLGLLLRELEAMGVGRISETSGKSDFIELYLQFYIFSLSGTKAQISKNGKSRTITTTVI